MERNNVYYQSKWSEGLVFSILTSYFRQLLQLSKCQLTPRSAELQTNARHENTDSVAQRTPRRKLQRNKETICSDPGTLYWNFWPLKKKRRGGCEGKKLLQTSWESQKPKIKGWHLKSAQTEKKTKNKKNPIPEVVISAARVLEVLHLTYCVMAPVVKPVTAKAGKLFL